MKKFAILVISDLFPTKKLRKKVRTKLRDPFFLRRMVVKFCSYFIAESQKRKIFRKLCNSPYIRFVFRKKKQYLISGNNNRVVIIENGKEYILPKYLTINGLEIKIEGNNNTIKIEFPMYRLKNNFFDICGDNNLISLKRSIHLICGFTISTSWGRKRSILIGENFNVTYNAFLRVEENGSEVIIGDDCMFAHDLFLRQGDGHTVLDENGSICNRATKMIIGNHVWIGSWARLCKNVCIPDGCIIGMGAVVTKKFSTTNSVIAGNPAKIVKENINWLHEDINSFS